MSNISKKVIAIALAATCMFSTGVILGAVDSPISTGITVSAASGIPEINTLTGSINLYKYKDDGNKVYSCKDTFRAYRSGKKIKRVYFKDTSGHITSSIPVSYTIKNWNSNKNSNNYITFKIKYSNYHKCVAYIVYNDNKEQRIVIETKNYNDFGYASNFGLVNHASLAVSQRWAVVFGGAEIGSVDCSGLFITYRNICIRRREDLLGLAKENKLKWGYVNNGIPRVHGLGLHRPGHIGIYTGGNSTIEARDYEGYSKKGAVVQRYDDARKMFKDGEWFYIVGVKYPVTGWVKVDDRAYYYQNGQYVINCTKKINGVTYKFSANGVSNKYPAESEYKKTQYKVYTK